MDPKIIHLERLPEQTTWEKNLAKKALLFLAKKIQRFSKKIQNLEKKALFLAKKKNKRKLREIPHKIFSRKNFPQYFVLKKFPVKF